MRDFFKNVGGLHTYISSSWTSLSGGQRLHIPLLGFVLFFIFFNGPWSYLYLITPHIMFKTVQQKSYLILAIWIIELKFYFGPAPELPGIEDESVLRDKQAKLVRLIDTRDMIAVDVLSRKLKLSTKGVEQLARSMGYVVEDRKVFKK